MKLAPNTNRIQFLLTRDPFSGALINADSTPSVAVYRNGTLDGSITPAVTNLSAGFYKFSYTVGATWSPEDQIMDVTSASVAGLPAKAIHAYTVDQTIASRLPSSSYIAPENARIASIATGVDQANGLLDLITTGGITADDALPAIRAAIEALNPASQGDLAINHNTGGTDALAYHSAGGAGIPDADVFAYLKADYDTGHLAPRGHATTDAAGRWLTPIYLNAGSHYTLVFSKPGAFGPDIQTLSL